MPSPIKYNFSSKTTPYPHQVEAISYIEGHTEIALFDEQGLGKTKIVIDAICNNLEDKVIGGALVICRKNLIQNWVEEIETHSYLKSIVLRGTAKEKGRKFMGYTHFYIINYESVNSELNRLSTFLRTRDMAIVLDESHAIKNPKAVVSKAIITLSKLAAKRIIVSGTPVANKPEDIWNQFFFLDQGQLLGEDYSAFKQTYKVDLKETEELDPNSKLSKLHEKIASHSIRRKKSDVLELPEKRFLDVSVEMPPAQQKLYTTLRDELRIEIENVDGDIVVDESSDLLKKLLRLAQVASNPQLVDKGYKEEPGKFPALDCLVGEILDRKEKLIIWSCFVDNIRMLNKRYKEFGTGVIYGQISIDRRNETIKKFKTDPSLQILIANPAAAKEGLTLTIANNAIYLDRNFNLVDYLQSQDRIHRISQTKECNIYKLIAKGTIDEFIDEIIRRKHFVAGIIQGDKNELGFNRNLSKEDILTYLGTI